MTITALLQYWPVAAFILGGFGALLKWQQAMFDRQLAQSDARNARTEQDRDFYRNALFQALLTGNKAASEAEKALMEKALVQSTEMGKP